MVQSDGIDVSVLKQNKESAKGGTRGIQEKEEDDFRHIHQLTRTELVETKDKCVLIDPRRRDMLFWMHEKSKQTKKSGCVYRYISNQRAVEIKARKFRKLRESKKPDSVKEHKDRLSEFPTSAITVSKFSEYINARSTADEPLKSYYSNENEVHGNRDIPPFRKLKLSSIINKQQSDHLLSKNLKEKFGDDAILVLEDWNAGRTKYHESIQGKGV